MFYEKDELGAVWEKRIKYDEIAFWWDYLNGSKKIKISWIDQFYLLLFVCFLQDM